MKETVSAVVLCHNRFSITDQCINALVSGNIAPDEIILVDNASSDETQKAFENDPRVKYIRREINDGSIIGRNIGIKAATGDRILVLDNDQIVSPYTIQKYLKYDADLVGCESRKCAADGVGHVCRPDGTDNRVYLGIGGLMVKREVFEKIGYLDEGFAPAYCDDPDFFWRAFDAGFTFSYCYGAKIYHFEHATLGAIATSEAYNKSHKRLIEKWPDRFNMNQPLVSFVIPTYNRVGFLPECIGSIKAQTYRNIEIIVVDDGSTDGTEELIKTKYPEVRYFYHDNHRIPYTLNRGFRAARGKYICWVSSDDGITPGKTARQVEYMEEHENIDLSFHGYEIRHEASTSYPQYIEFENNQNEFIYCIESVICNNNGSTSMFRASKLKTHGLFIEVLFTCQDWEMWLRYLKNGTVGYIPDNMGWRYEHAGVGQGIPQKEPEALRLFAAEVQFIKDYYRMFVGPRPTICAMLVVKNEEDMIEQCLDDLILWVDKIVIIDDGSTDRTPELITQYPKVVDIYTQADKGNVRYESVDRTRLLEMAQATECDWILFIDADEVFEDIMKAQVYDLITNPDVNLWHFHEINFWRSRDEYRVDEMYNLGWFGRLFRNLPDLKIAEKNEHCGGIPNNIPECTMWGVSKRGKRSDVGVKHYGFVNYNRTVKRAARRYIRDPLRVDERGNKHGGYVYYERMINETGLVTIPYKEKL